MVALRLKVIPAQPATDLEYAPVGGGNARAEAERRRCVPSIFRPTRFTDLFASSHSEQWLSRHLTRGWRQPLLLLGRHRLVQCPSKRLVLADQEPVERRWNQKQPRRLHLRLFLPLPQNDDAALDVHVVRLLGKVFVMMRNGFGGAGGWVSRVPRRSTLPPPFYV